jgi:DNA-directed RNA polymerase subunit RPC12/RpoP
MKAFRLYPPLYGFLAFVVCATALFVAFSEHYWPLPIALYLTLLLIALALLVRSHSRDTVYTCRACNAQFEITAWRDFISPHTLTQKYLKCPRCGTRSWATVHEKRPGGGQLSETGS